MSVANRHSIRAVLTGFAMIAATIALPCDAAAQAAVKKGSVEKITVHGNALAGNLAGEPADRTVFVYLPPSYGTERNRRYPVAYLLHGYGLTGERWMTFARMSEAADRAMAAGTVKEMILVNPDSWTKNGGSMYSSSPTSGDWETFMAEDLVKYIDSHYRTIATREGRGLGGHSMGGYGTVRPDERPDTASRWSRPRGRWCPARCRAGSWSGHGQWTTGSGDGQRRCRSSRSCPWHG
jgi:S-formylglutathione hydrolase